MCFVGEEKCAKSKGIIAGIQSRALPRGEGPVCAAHKLLKGKEDKGESNQTKGPSGLCGTAARCRYLGPDAKNPIVKKLRENKGEIITDTIVHDRGICYSFVIKVLQVFNESLLMI